jgi:hypothetical protein
MFTFTAGVLERTRLVSNVLMLLLLIGNIFFSIQYTENIKQKDLEARTDRSEQKTKTALFLKLFVDKVINTQGTVSFEDRVKLENDIRQLGIPEIITQWETFVASADSETAQQNAVKLMSMLITQLI